MKSRTFAILWNVDCSATKYRGQGGIKNHVLITVYIGGGWQRIGHIHFSCTEGNTITNSKRHEPCKA
jgi:hypothetical protein